MSFFSSEPTMQQISHAKRFLRQDRKEPAWNEIQFWDSPLSHWPCDHGQEVCYFLASGCHLPMGVGLNGLRSLEC